MFCLATTSVPLRIQALIQSSPQRRRQKGLVASQPSDCNVMFKGIQRSSSLYSKYAAEKILIQKLI